MSGRAITDRFRLLAHGQPENVCWQTDRTLGEMSAEATTGFPLDPPMVIEFTGLPQFGKTTWATRPAPVRAIEPVAPGRNRAMKCFSRQS